MFDKPRLSEPNKEGYQFGIDKALTDYAHERQERAGGQPLPPLDVTVLQVWKDDKRVSYLLVDENSGYPIDRAYGFEAAAALIDMYKLSKAYEADSED